MPAMLSQGRFAVGALALLSLVLPIELAAEEPASEAAERFVLLELFTSQGCSSCPPADRLLRRLGQEEGIIALSLHVDYWNRLGWKDPFSKAAFSQRQGRYARALGERGVYTPQVVVDGRSHVVGSDEDEIRAAIAGRRATAPSARLQIELAEGDAFLEATVLRSPAADLEVVAALYEKGLVTPVPRGENGGRTLHNDYVVRRLWTLGTIPKHASGIHRFPLGVDLDGDLDEAGDERDRRLGLAAFLQEPASMRVYGATARFLPNPDD